MQRYALAFIISILMAVVGYVVAALWGGADDTLNTIRDLGVGVWVSILGLSLLNYSCKQILISRDRNGSVNCLHNVR